MKQTAVEWLEVKLDNIGLNADIIGDYIQQAKEMEKQQVIDAHGNQTKKYGGISNHNYILTGEEYYNKTYKK